MEFIKCDNELELTNKKTVQVNIFYKENYIYRIEVVENENIIKVTKEDTKSEYYEVEYFKIK